MKTRAIVILNCLLIFCFCAFASAQITSSSMTGKYVLDSDNGEGWVLISDQGSEQIAYSFQIAAANGRMDWSNCRANVTGSMAKDGTTTFEFIEKVDKNNKKYLILNLTIQGVSFGPFIKKDTKAREM